MKSQLHASIVTMCHDIRNMTYSADPGSELGIAIRELHAAACRAAGIAFTTGDSCPETLRSAYPNDDRVDEIRGAL